MFIVALTNFLKLILLDPRFYLATNIKVTFLSTNAKAVFRCKKYFSISEFPKRDFSFPLQVMTMTENSRIRQNEISFYTAE